MLDKAKKFFNTNKEVFDFSVLLGGKVKLSLNSYFGWMNGQGEFAVKFMGVYGDVDWIQIFGVNFWFISLSIDLSW